VSEDRRLRIYALNECEWWAGFDMESTIQAHLKNCGLSREEAVDEPYELTEEQMDTTQFRDDETREPRTFRQQLDVMVERGESFPAFFATTEY
jgi:hypothetical protein